MNARVIFLFALAGCNGWFGVDADGNRSDVNPGDRKILGVPEPYPADPTLRGRQAELDGSMRARRDVAWQVVARVLDPVPLAERSDASVPRFQTWYAKDDFVRLFQHLSRELGRDGRQARAPFGEQAITDAFQWNAHMVDSLPTWPQDRWQKYLERLADPLAASGEGAGHRVSYSSDAIAHVLRNYSGALACLPRLPGVGFDDPPQSDDNFTLCYDSEFPLGAAFVKAQWRRAELGIQVPTFDTSDVSTRDNWEQPDGQADPTADRIHTVRLSNGNVFRLVGLHIMTKELRHWIWITLWWSPDPDTDFGADRPSAIRGVWRNYKMCVATAYAEGDPAAAPGPTWCSNPYLEHGPGNARTNCIGCHQHGGSTLDTGAIVSQFPQNGRTELRRNFPTDYSWAYDKGDALVRVMAQEAAYWDATDK